MNNLTTRKIVLGMLMALVLAFSVQGIADALTFKESRSGDLKTLLPGDKFTIRFSISPDSSRDIFDTNQTPKRQVDETAAKIDSSGYKVRGIEVDGKTKYYRIADSRIVDNSGYVIHEGPDDKPDPTDTTEPITQIEQGDRDKDADGLIKAEPEPPVFDSLQHHGNDEAVAIVVTGGTLSSLKKGDTELFRSATALTQQNDFVSLDLREVSLIEETKNRDLDSDLTLTSSTTLTGRVGGEGKYTIKIVDMTPLSDYPNEPIQRAALTFTIYVVPAADRATVLTRVGAEVQFGNDLADPQIDDDFGPATPVNRPIIYEVEGSGRVYIREDSVNNADGYGGTLPSPRSQGSAAKRLETSSDAHVYLDMGGGSSQVTVWHRGQNPTNTAKSVAYVYDYAVITKTSGDNQVGATGGRLEELLAVKVTDAKNRPVPGLRVQFDNPNVSVTDDSFIPFPDTTVYTDGSRTLATAQADETRIATSSSPDPSDGGDLIYVQTDSSGEAKVYYQLGSDETETQDVTVMVQGDTETFTLDADDDARRASLQMISMEKATGTGKEGIYYLTVIARSVGGHRIPKVIIEFEALSGSLRPRPSTGQPVQGSGDGELPRVASSGNEIFVITGADGEAAVEYNVGPNRLHEDCDRRGT